MKLGTTLRPHGARIAVAVAAVGLLTAGVAAPASGQVPVERSVAAGAENAVPKGAAPVTAVAGVPLSPSASDATRAIAAADPRAVEATANLCGAGYNLQHAEQLPDSRRLGTIFTYQKNVEPFSSCAIFDNNTGVAKYMKLKLCPNDLSKPCNVDEGNFSQYAGPVRVTDGWCAKVNAIMKNTKTSTTALIDRQFLITCN